MPWITLAIALVIGPAGAEERETSHRISRSSLEESIVNEALAHFGLEEDPRPEGKRIERIEVYVAEVFDDRDPIPNFVNIFHVRTRPWAIEQEVLLNEGQIWNWGRVVETERNLRELKQLSLANVVATKGSSNASVVLLVVTKDVWSLRLNSSWSVTSSGLEYMLLNPSEWNLAGTRTTLGGLFYLQRDRYLVGGNFSYPRIGGSRLEMGVTGGVYNNRHTGDYEGNYGSFVFQLPQYSRFSRWAYGVSAQWRFSITRLYSGSAIDEFVFESGEVSERIPMVYDEESLDGNYWALRSFGVLHKADVEFGIETVRTSYRTPDYDRFSDEALNAFRDEVLPVSDTRLSPYVSLSVYQTKFHRVLDLETLALQEDLRLGYGVSTTLFAAARALGSSRDLVGSIVKAGYTWALGDGMVRLGASNRIVIANASQNEGFVSLRGRVVTPSLRVARLHVDAFVGHRYEDYLNVAGYQLGGNNRLRGYPADWFDGTNLVSFNAELRTKSVNILSARVGMGVFYDVGGADFRWNDLSIYQGAGLGLRILFPQFDRYVMRLDWGLPLSSEWATFPGRFAFSFGQAFSMPSPGGGGSPFEEL